MVVMKKAQGAADVMKRHLLAAAAALTCSFAGISVCSAQTATFIYNDGNGTPNQGTYSAGSSFTFLIDIAFTPGGSVSNLEGLSYWFQQITGPGGGVASSPFNFAITNRNDTGSPFTDLQTPSITYPQNLNPQNANDLGGLQPSGTPPLGAGTYEVANLTVSIANTAAPGTYYIDDVTSGGKTSVITDSQGHTFRIPEADYTIVVVPEPATWAGPTLALAMLLLTQRRRISRLWRAA